MIELELRGKTITVPSKWNELTSGQFIYLSGLLNNFATGKLSPAEVRMLFLCHCLHINISRRGIKKDAYANLYAISNHLNFFFSIEYDKEAISALSPETRKLIRKTPPEELEDTPEIRYCRKLEYKYVIDAIFCAQLLPVVRTGRYKRAKAYSIDTSFGVLSTSLTALQFIEASEILSGKNSALKLPLLASILYAESPYNSEKAHASAARFTRLSVATLTAISINFEAFAAYLFKGTEFSILNHGSDKKKPSIATGMIETLYNLSADGLGDAASIKQMNLIDFLTIMRKKLIESVKSMHDMGKKLPEIEDETRLPIEIITKILEP